MTQITQNTLAPSAGLPLAWSPFARKLAVALARLEENQYLVLSVKHSGRYIQFAAQGSCGMRAETTSNNYLAAQEQLDGQQVAALTEAGWHAPTGRPGESTPESDPHGSPNFFADLPAPVSYEAVADLTVRTLADILRVPHPDTLEYAAFDAGTALEIPELGLPPAKRTQPAGDPGNLPLADVAPADQNKGKPGSSKYTIKLGQIPQAIDQLRLSGKDASWIVFCFDTPIQSPLTDDRSLNLQYSIIDGVVGLDWVLLGQRNIADQEKITRFIRSRKHKVAKRCLNKVFYLRVEDGDLAGLGNSIVGKLYGVASDAEITLLVDGCVMPPDWQPRTPPVPQQLLATLREKTGISDLDYDQEGYISVRCGSTVTFVQLNADPSYVRIYSAIVREVEESAALYDQLNQLNSDETLMRFVFRNGAIYAVAEISAVPYVGAHVAQAFEHVSAIADGIGAALQAEFGGQTAFIEPMLSLTKH